MGLIRGTISLTLATVAGLLILAGLFVLAVAHWINRTPDGGEVAD